MKAHAEQGWRCPNCHAVHWAVSVKPSEHPCFFGEADPEKAAEPLVLWRCSSCQAFWLEEKRAESCCSKHA